MVAAAPAAVAAAEMAEAMLEHVRRTACKLQGRLLATSDPLRLCKYLRQLSVLPMTAEILGQTGLRKTVKGLRRHQQVGTLARALAAQWKSLAPARPKPGPGRLHREGRGGARALLPPEGSEAWGCTHPRAAPAGPELGGAGLPDLPSSLKPSPKPCCPSLGSTQRSPRGLPPPFPAWEAPFHQDQLKECCLGAPAPVELAAQCYGWPADLGASPTGLLAGPQCYAQAAQAEPGLAQGGPVWGPREEEQEASWSTRSARSKTPIYSACPEASRQHKMAFYQHCRQVLSSNLDAIRDVSLIPDCVLLPVLEKCSPHQLRRIETCNPGLAEKTHHLWRRHCHRDFKGQAPEGQESWRQMFLRLQDARAQRLREVTSKIRLARAKEPPRRQSKLLPFGAVPTARQKENCALGGPAREGGRRGRGRGRGGDGEAGREGGQVDCGGGRGIGGRGGGRAGARVGRATPAAAASAAAVGTTAANTATVLAKPTMQGAEQPTQSPTSHCDRGSGSGSGTCSGPSGRCANPSAYTQAHASRSTATVPLKPALNTGKRTAKKTGPLLAKSIRDYKKIRSRC